MKIISHRQFWMPSEPMGETAEEDMAAARPWEELPDECWEAIFACLGGHHHPHLEPLSLVCKRLLTLTNLGRAALTLPSPSSSPSSVPHSLYSRFPNLTSLHLRHAHPSLDRFVRELAASALPLRSLHLSWQTHFPRTAMRHLGRRMRKTLKSLSCSWFSFITDDDLLVIANCFSYLEQLELDHSGSRKREISDRGIGAISSKMRSLLSLNISSLVDCLSNRSLEYLSSNCPSLRHLNASFSHNTVVYLDFLFSDGKFASLSSLELLRVNISDSVLVQLSRADLKLRKLVLGNPSGDGISNGALFRFLKSCRSLRHLDLQNLTLSADMAASDIASSIPNLEFVSLCCCNQIITGITLFNLFNNCPSLEEVHMVGTFMGSFGNWSSLAVHYRYRVRTLHLVPYGGLSDESLMAIASACPRLEYLSVSQCQGITGYGIGAVMTNCKNIKRLDIRCCDMIEDLGLDVECPNLEELDASQTGIGDKWLSVAWRTCKNLRSLRVASSTVTKNGLVEFIKNHKQLKELHINEMFGWTISDTDLASLVFSSVSLKKIFLPDNFTMMKDQRDLFLRHGCLVRAGCRIGVDYP